MGDAKRRQAILGEGYGAKPLPTDSLLTLEEKSIMFDLKQLMDYRNRFDIVDNELVEDECYRSYTESWFVDRLRSYPNAFSILYWILRESYLDFLHEVIYPIVGENIAVYSVETGCPLIPVNCKTDEEALGRLSILFLRGQLKSLSECAFVYYRWDIVEPEERFCPEKGIQAHILDNKSIRLKEKYVAALLAHNVAKKCQKLTRRGVKETTARLFLAQKLQVRPHRLSEVWDASA